MDLLRTIGLILLWPALIVVGGTAILLLAGYVRDRWFDDIDTGHWLLGVVGVLTVVLASLLSIA